MKWDRGERRELGARKKPRGRAEWSPAEVQGKPCRGEAKESAGKMTDKEIMPRRESGSLRVWRTRELNKGVIPVVGNFTPRM